MSAAVHLVSRQHNVPSPTASGLPVAKVVVQFVGWAWFRPHPAPNARKTEGGFGDLLADLD